MDGNALTGRISGRVLQNGQYLELHSMTKWVLGAAGTNRLFSFQILWHSLMLQNL